MSWKHLRFPAGDLRIVLLSDHVSQILRLAKGHPIPDAEGGDSLPFQ